MAGSLKGSLGLKSGRKFPIFSFTMANENITSTNSTGIVTEVSVIMVM